MGLIPSQAIQRIVSSFSLARLFRSAIISRMGSKPTTTSCAIEVVRVPLPNVLPRSSQRVRRQGSQSTCVVDFLSIMTGRGNFAIVWRERPVQDSVFVFQNRSHRLTGGYIPHSGRLVQEPVTKRLPS